METDIAALFLKEIDRRLFGECFPRLEKCLTMLSEDQIWHRPNTVSNSIGNLVLHLKGNTRQWLGTTFGGRDDDRERQSEFDERGPIGRDHLLQMVRELKTELQAILKPTTPQQLSQVYNVQVYQENGVSILVHVTEHFSYHLGQITYVTKMLTGRETGYYEGQDLG